MALAIIFIAITALLPSPATARLSPATSPTPSPSPAPAFVDLGELLALAGPYHTFLKHLNDSHVLETFQRQANNTAQGITIFSPSDKAFSQIFNPSLASLTDDQLRSLLLYHAFPKFYSLNDLLKNLSTLGSVATMAGGQFTLNIKDSSGLVLVDSDWSNTSISSSVYSAVPVAVYKIDKVLLPRAIFSTEPNLSPQASPPGGEPPSPSDSPPAPPSDSPDNAPTPQPETPADKPNDESAAYRTCFGPITFFAFIVSSVFMLLL